MSQSPINGGSGPPDWGVIGGALATLAGIVAAVVAGIRSAVKEQKTERQQAAAARDKSSIDHATLTLDSVFRLVNELQGEVARKDDEITRVETWFVARQKHLEDRIVILETASAGHVALIEKLEREIRDLKRAQGTA